MAAEIKTYVKLQIPAGDANPSPPVGPALGQHGLPIQDFCKQFNSRSENLERGMLVPVVITVFEDRTFTFVIKSPPASVLLKKIAGITKGSGTPNMEKVAKVTRPQLEEIVKIKQADLTAAELDAAVRTIAGSARSMGITVEEI